MHSTDLLQKIFRKGWQTSEFAVSLLGIVVATVLPHADKIVGQAGEQLTQHGDVGAIAAGAIAGAYAVGRSILKAQAAKSLLAPVYPPVTVPSEPPATPPGI